MVNPARGEVALDVDGAPHTLRLTLAALAEIEAALKVDGLSALGEAFKTLGAQDLNRVLAALLRAGGAEQAEALADRADPMAALKAVAACFKANLI